MIKREPINARALFLSDRSAWTRKLDWRWVLVCLAMVAGMAYLRFVVYPTRVVPLTYALPLLACLWNRDLRLLWGMTAVFLVMVGMKMSMLISEGVLSAQSQWAFGSMQLANILIAAGVIHMVIRLASRLETGITLLEKTNAELEASNEELAAREEEITQQNEELVSQAEELEQQTEELNTQTEELQTLNGQLSDRERTLGDLLETSAGGASEAETLAKLGEMVVRLMGSRVVGAAVLEPRGGDMIVRPLVGIGRETQRVKRDRTMAELVLSRDRAGFLADLSMRPDLDVPKLEEGVAIRSVVAAPLRDGDAVRGALEIYAGQAGEWSEHELRIVRWLAEQCGRLWTTSRLREDLERQRRLLRTVTDASTVALLMVDEQGYCTYLNPAAERLTGYGLKDLRGAPLHDVVRLQDTNGERQLLATSSGGPEQAVDVMVVQRGGESLPVMLSTTRIAGDHDSVATVIEMVDASVQRRNEAEREKLLDSERFARSEAERANRAKDEFVATLSHELRTPLNAVLGWAALLRKNGWSDLSEVAKGVEVIERNARHQSQLISDLLDISRITAGKIRLDVQTVDLPLVIESALESVRPAADAKGVRLERVIETVDRAVMGDPNRLQQVVWNLLSNAIKFTPREGRVQVVVSRVASYVQITVSDTGEGIEPALLPHLFERYRQADGSATRRHGGLGLGLAIAKHLIELHGGSIHARSDGPGKGAALSVLLPVRAAEPHAAVDGPHPLTQAAIALDSSSPTLERLSILVVDDEEDARDLIARILRNRGADVRTAGSGAEALEMLEQSKPDLLISDVGMPGMDGYTLIRSVRERWPDSARALPAVALTAFARSEDRTRALLAGFQSHIAKPVEAAELVATVASLRFSVPR